MHNRPEYGMDKREINRIYKWQKRVFSKSLNEKMERIESKILVCVKQIDSISNSCCFSARIHSHHYDASASMATRILFCCHSNQEQQQATNECNSQALLPRFSKIASKQHQSTKILHIAVDSIVPFWIYFDLMHSAKEHVFAVYLKCLWAANGILSI